MKIPIVTRHIGCIVLLVSLIGCNTPTVLTMPPELVTVPSSPTMTLSPIVELSTDIPTPILSTRTPVLTLAPTLTTVEEEALVLEMLKDNSGCQLPCWWGFRPGETSWEIPEAFFISWGKEIEAWQIQGTHHYTVYFDISSQNHYHYQGYHEKNGLLDRIGIHALPPTNEDGNPAYGDPQFTKQWAAYLPAQMLITYGQPSQILLGVSRETPWVPFDLLLFYPEQGILAQYSGSANMEGEVFQIYPYQVEITLYLWAPGDYSALVDVPGIGGYTYSIDEMSGIRPLGSVTELSIEQFYQTFMQPDTQICLETPMEIW